MNVKKIFSKNNNFDTWLKKLEEEDDADLISSSCFASFIHQGYFTALYSEALHIIYNNIFKRFV